MKKKYKIEVDCAACALKAEDAARKVSGVEDCTVNFLTETMTVKFKENAEEQQVLTEIKKVCKKVDPDFEFID